MEMNFHAYHLYFSGPLHPGIESIGQEKIEKTIRSDTLWGAIIQAWLLLFDDSPAEVIKGGYFDVSSCFPLIQNTRFFPSPVGLFDKLMEEVSKKPPRFRPSIKDLKKITHISESLLKKVAMGNEITLDDLIRDEKLTIYPLFHDSTDHFQVICQRPRIRINQLTGAVDADAFFYCSDSFFERNSGLFFLAKFRDDETKAKFDAALRLLGDTGLGADRSVGRGQFYFEESNLSLPEIESEAEYLLLSLYRPSRREVQENIMSSPASRYQLIRRWGRAASVFTSGFRRADSWMFAEGSVFSFKPEGTVPKVLRENDEVPHDVYRYGRAFTLPITKRKA